MPALRPTSEDRIRRVPPKLIGTHTPPSQVPRAEQNRIRIRRRPAHVGERGSEVGESLDQARCALETGSLFFFLGLDNGLSRSALEYSTGANIRKLEKVQKRYIRRILRLQKRSEHHILYSETSIMPIGYRLLILALRFLRYLVYTIEWRSSGPVSEIARPSPS